MSLPPPKRSLFNPHRLGDKDLERTFIARQRTFQELLADIVAEEAQSIPQLQLVVGQRGMGKTTLLLRLALELRREPYRARFIPLTFPEEQYVEVDRLSKFWLNCLDALADTLEYEASAPAEVVRIDTEVKALERAYQTEELLAHESQRAFEEASQRVGRRPVLLIDNFHLLLRRLKAGEHVLRAFFTTAGAPILVAAATVLPHDDQDYAAAFYEHFKLRVLNRLTLEEMEEIIAVLAREANHPDTLNRLAAERPRLAALRDMTGGNPRTTGLLFDLFSQQLSSDAYEDLEALADIITPLYQSRLDQLSDQGQVIVGALARHWEPITAAELQEQARLPQGSVSPQLGRLEDLGVIEKTPVFPEKKTGYQIAERFFNVWYLMRFSSRRQRGDLACLVHFLQAFYTPVERAQSAGHLLRRSALEGGRVPYDMALAQTLEPELAERLELKAQLDLIAQMDGLRERIAEILDPDEIPTHLYDFAELKRRLIENCPEGSDLPDLILGSPSLLPGGKATKPLDRNALATQKLTEEQAKKLRTELEQERNTLERRYGTTAVPWLATRQREGLLTVWTDAEQVSNTFLRAPEATLPLMRAFASSYAMSHLSQAAFERLRTVCQPKENASAWEWFFWGIDLQFALRAFSDAETAYRRAIELDPKTVWMWINLGILLHEHLGRYTEAELAYHRAIELDPKHAASWNNLGFLLQVHLNRYTEAEEAYRRTIELDSKAASPWNGLGNLLQDHLGRYAEAEEAYHKAIELDSKDAIPWLNLIFLYRDVLGKRQEAQGLLERAPDSTEARDTKALHTALFAAYESDTEQVISGLMSAFAEVGDVLPITTQDDWWRAVAVLVHLGQAEVLLQVMRETGARERMLPFYGAVEAHAHGDRRYLYNLPMEARPAAEQLYDQIQKRREKLPEATRRAPRKAK